jgi:hypothetical protein
MTDYPYRIHTGNLDVPFSDYNKAYEFAAAQSRQLPGRHQLRERWMSDPSRWQVNGWFENGAWTGSNSHIGGV